MSSAVAARPDTRVPVSAGANVAALIPQTIDEAWRIAQAFAASGMAPNGMNKAEQIMVAVMAGAELGLAPFQAVQSFAVINQRPTLWGDALVAVVRARGVVIVESIEGEGDDMTATCSAVRPDTRETITRTFSVADARKAGLWNKSGPWQSYPKRMLTFRARAYALRDGCADMLRGVYVREEVDDYQPIVAAPQPSGLASRMAQRQITGDQSGFSTANVEEAITVEATPAADAKAEDAPATDTEAFAWDEFLAGEAKIAETHSTAAAANNHDEEVRKTLDALSAPEDVRRSWATINAESLYRVAKVMKGKRP